MAGPAFTLRDIDRGWASLLAAAEKEAALRGSFVKAGMVGDAALAVEHQEQGEGAGEALTNVQLMAWHEFGVPGGVPERSVIRHVFDEKEAQYLSALRALVGTWFDRKGKVEILRALGVMGLKMVSDFKAYVLTGEGVPPPLAPSTIRRKIAKGRWKSGSEDAPRALVDTGRMLAAMSHAVVTGSSEREGGVVVVKEAS